MYVSTSLLLLKCLKQFQLLYVNTLVHVAMAVIAQVGCSSHQMKLVALNDEPLQKVELAVETKILKEVKVKLSYQLK